MKYSKARAEVVMFDNTDVITTSCGWFLFDSLEEKCPNGSGRYECTNGDGQWMT